MYITSPVWDVRGKVACSRKRLTFFPGLGGMLSIILLVGLHAFGDVPLIDSDPQNQTVSLGDAVVFSAVVSGTEPIFHLWQQDGLTLTDTGRVSGASTAELTIAAVDWPDEASVYRLIVTNVSGAVTSAVATLTITGSLAIIDHHP